MMTHDELLAKVEKQTIHIANKIRPVANDCEKEIGGFANAIRQLVLLHSHKMDNHSRCTIDGQLQPCVTLRVIEEQLH